MTLFGSGNSAKYIILQTSTEGDPLESMSNLFDEERRPYSLENLQPIPENYKNPENNSQS